MDTIELRNALLVHIRKADNRLLKMIKSLIDRG